MKKWGVLDETRRDEGQKLIKALVKAMEVVESQNRHGVELVRDWDLEDSPNSGKLSCLEVNNGDLKGMEEP